MKHHVYELDDDTFDMTADVSKSKLYLADQFCLILKIFVVCSSADFLLLLLISLFSSLLPLLAPLALVFLGGVGDLSCPPQQ